MAYIKFCAALSAFQAFRRFHSIFRQILLIKHSTIAFSQNKINLEAFMSISIFYDPHPFTINI
ncbi:hypothetical protein BDI4_580047 [Burkholderia diffusa]|nr:hypothetical protein BDI4_580047 [Burkholderia diffusa]